jgi:hypothetical protein
VITNIYNKKTKGPTLMELFTAFRSALGRTVPPLPRDLTDLKARIIAAVKNIDAPILTRVWQELEYRIDVTMSPVVDTSNTSSCQKKSRFLVAMNNSIKVSPLVFLL